MCSYLGITAFERGDFQTARDHFELRLKEAKKTGNKDSDGGEYGNLGIAYRSLGKFEKAIEFHQQHLSIAKKTGNKDSEGSAYVNLGLAYHSLGKFEKAIEFHQQGLSIAKKTGNKDTVGNAYVNLGAAYDSLGKFEKAIEFHQQALSIAKKTGNKVTVGKAYGNLGLTYHSLGKFEKAIEFHQQDLSIAKKTGDKDSEGSAYLNLGLVYHSLGKFEKAIEFHQQALSIAKKTGNKNSEGSAYLNLGLAYDYLGKFEEAIEFHQQALSIAKKTGNEDSEGRAYGNLGLAYVSLGKFEKAIEFHQQALSIAKKTGSQDSEGKTYVNLGGAYLFVGNFENAIKCLQRGLSIAKTTKNKDTEGKAYGNLGLVYRSLGDFEKAIEFHHQYLSIAKKIGNKVSESRAYLNLGNAYGSLDNFEKAIELYQQSLSIAEEIGDKVVEAKAYSNLGVTFTGIGNYCIAEECFKSSINLLEKIRGLLLEKDEWKISFRDQYRDYTTLSNLQLRRGNTIAALLTAERGRAQALVDALKLKYGVKTVKSSPEEQMNKMDILSGQTSSPTLFIAEDENCKSVNIWLLLKSQKLQFIRKESSQTLTDLINKSYKQIGVKELVRCGGCSFGDESEDEEIEVSSDRGTNENASSQDECALKTMYEVIIAPISQWITDDELIIVPDGSSFFVPYAALVDQHSRYLSETLRIRLAPSLTTLRLLTDCPEGHHSTSGALLVGNPWVETVRFPGKFDKLAPLPGAEEEVKIIGQILNIEPLIGKNATKDQVLSEFQSVSLVHIAAHGHAETGEIILSPNNASSKKPEEEDFLLSMADVLNAKLNAKLVVLSCCYTGRGKIKAEGVVGIARSFLAAGARAVIASLWAISDEATLAFMKHFYKQLMAGQSASKSLNQTMKWMQKTGDFSAVKYWAPFMLIGDDVTMDFGQSR